VLHESDASDESGRNQDEGATAAVSKAIEEARAVGAKFLKEAVLRVTRGASEDATDRVIALSHEGLEASRTVDDAVRQYLSENGGTTDLRAPVVRAANRAIRLRAAAELIADRRSAAARGVPTDPRGARGPCRRDLCATDRRSRPGARIDQ
jgi:hypothetical protein